jgi:stage V sporulation protein SpoVS
MGESWAHHQTLARKHGHAELVAIVPGALTSTIEALAPTLVVLREAGLVEKASDQFIPTETQIRLGNDSHHIFKHHTNWRVKVNPPEVRE